jgi:hypothetical protein
MFQIRRLDATMGYDVDPWLPPAGDSEVLFQLERMKCCHGTLLGRNFDGLLPWASYQDEHGLPSFSFSIPEDPFEIMQRTSFWSKGSNGQ